MGIADLDKLFRKLSIKFIQPYELYSIADSFVKTVELIQLLLSSNFKSNLFVESKDENFDIVVFGTYLELFEYHGLFSIIEESIMKMFTNYRQYYDKLIVHYIQTSNKNPKS